MAGKFSIEAVFKAIDRVSAPVSRMQNRVSKFARGASRRFRDLNRQVDKLATGFKATGIAAAASLLIVGSAMGDVVRTGAQFEQTLVSAAAKFPEGIRKGTKEFQALEEIARQTGATTEFTASQAASGLNFLAMAGFNAQQSIAALPAVVDLATAAGVDLATASDIATDSLGAFGLATKDATQLGKNLARVNDVLAKTTTTANTSMEAMFEAVVKGAPDFTKGGQSLETFSALVGTLANSGKKGAEAGTALRNVILRLASPAKEAQEIMDDLGINVQDSNGNFRDAIDILGDFEKATKGMGEVQRTAALSTVFGARAVGSVNILLSAGTKELRDYRMQLEAAGGAAQNMAGVMRDTVQGRINSLSSAIEGLKITLFSLKNTAIAGLLDSMIEWVRMIDTAFNANTELSASLIDGVLQAAKGVIQIIGLLTGAYVAMKTFTIAVTVATNAWSIALGVLKGVMFALNMVMRAGPLGAFMLLIALAGLLIANWDKVVKFITTTLNIVAGPFMALVGGLMTAFKAASGLFGGGESEIVTPQERVAKTIDERRETSTAELTIRDETGKAELTKSNNVKGIGLTLAESGAF